MSDTIQLEDHEFIFLGGFVRTHTLVVGEDAIAESETQFLVLYPSKNQSVDIYKDKLLQHSKIEREVAKVTETAVQKVVRELHEKELKRQGVTGPMAAGPTPTQSA